MTSTFSLNIAQPGARTPLHTHVLDELILTVEGQLEVRIDGKTQIVEKDHTLVVPPRAEHGFKVGGDQRLSFWFSSPRWNHTNTIIPNTWKELFHSIYGKELTRVVGLKTHLF